ncbi:hypothetical protein BX666DRAFT_2033121 [Dichotomocladium elegans]|nr:hypothetical protein BX666DRAFT_2033121 [Dichotomocladium elegans]
MIENYKIAFEQITQGETESPRMFLGRIQQAANLAEFAEHELTSLTFNKFKTGLLPQVKRHCITMGASSFEQYKAYANAYWRGTYGTTSYPQEDPFSQPTTEDNVPISWRPRHKTDHRRRDTKLQDGSSQQRNGEYSPVTGLINQMKNLELYQHDNQQTIYNQENGSLENMIRRLIREETRNRYNNPDRFYDNRPKRDYGQQRNHNDHRNNYQQENRRNDYRQDRPYRGNQNGYQRNQTHHHPYHAGQNPTLMPANSPNRNTGTLSALIESDYDYDDEYNDDLYEPEHMSSFNNDFYEDSYVPELNY